MKTENFITYLGKPYLERVYRDIEETLNLEQEYKKLMEKSKEDIKKFGQDPKEILLNNLPKANGTGLRFNEGKRRLDLVPQAAIDGIADVLAFGAKKYAENNWRKGMAWSKITSSLKRHLAAIERGEDFDEESGLFHIDHVLTNAAFLKEYYKIYPQGDDRQHRYLNMPKIGLDIDEVLCDWVGAWCQLYGMCTPTAWCFDNNILDRFKSMKENNTLDEFYSSLQPLVRPENIPFEPHCYVTSRPVDTSITTKWLETHGFPLRPVITVPVGTSKVDVLKEQGVEIFVDDRFENFVELNNAGICTYLWDKPHNRRYNVGYRRLKSFKDLI